MNTAIGIFCYNRVKSLEKCIESLKKNDEISECDLIIYSDGSKNNSDLVSVKNVRSYIETVSGFKSVKIVYRDKNYGLSENIIDGITDLFKKYESIIVIEDDLVLSKYFIKFMREALQKYRNNRDVMCISGYKYPSNVNSNKNFFLKGAECWGWATWRRSWELFERDAVTLYKNLHNKKLQIEFNESRNGGNLEMLERQAQGQISSWAIRWHASVFINNGLTLFPNFSLVNNLGFDNNGTNCRITSIYDVQISSEPILMTEIEVAESKMMKREIRKYFRRIELENLWVRLKNYILLGN